MPILKKRQIDNLQKMTPEELEEFLAAFPADRFDMDDLFDFLEEKLATTECNHSLRFAMQFIMENRLDFPKLTAWLQQNGGFCDCKVREQIAPAWKTAFD